MKIIIFLALSLKLKIRHIGNPVGSIKVELDARFKLTPKGAKRLYFTLLNFNNFQFRRRSLSISSSSIVTNVYIQNSPHKKKQPHARILSAFTFQIKSSPLSRSISVNAPPLSDNRTTTTTKVWHCGRKSGTTSAAQTEIEMCQFYRGESSFVEIILYKTFQFALV